MSDQHSFPPVAVLIATQGSLSRSHILVANYRSNIQFPLLMRSQNQCGIATRVLRGIGFGADRSGSAGRSRQVQAN